VAYWPKQHGGIPPQAILDALLVQPAEAAGCRTVVVTARPDWWAGADADVLEVSLRAESSSRPESELGARVLTDLLRVGWPRDLIRTEYSPDVHSRWRADIALTDGKGAMIAALELKSGPTKWAQSSQLAWPRSAGEWSFLATPDGFFKLRDDGEVVEVQTPSPSDLGVVLPSGPLERVPLEVILSGGLALVLPEGDLSVVLDPSLPVGIRDRRGKGTVDSGVLAASSLMSLARVKSISLVAPTSLLFRTEASPTRATWLGQKGLLAVVEFAPGVIPDAQIGSCLVVLGGGRHSTLFEGATTQGALSEPSRWRDPLAAWLQDSRPSSATYPMPTGEGPWTLGANDPSIRELPERLGQFAKVARLSDVAEIATRDEHHPDEPILYRRLLTRHVAIPRFSLPDDATTSTPGHDVVVEPGDVVVVVVGGAPRAAVFDGDGPAIAANGLVRVRIVSDELDAPYLVDYLNSDLAERYLNAHQTGVAIQRIPPKALSDMPIPLVSSEVRESLAESRVAAVSLQQALGALNDSRSSLFGAGSEGQFREKVQELRARTSAQTASLELLDDLTFRVRNFYPYPIAYGYRVAAAAAGEAEMLREQLRFAENMLAFLAGLSLSLIEPVDRPTLDLDFKRLWQGGISPGHWRDALVKANAVLGTYSGSALAQSLVKLKPQTNRNATFGGATDRLIRRMNDWKHNRVETDPSDIAALVRETNVDLDQMISALLFLCDYRIHRVEKLDFSRDGRTVTVDSAVLRGDHPALARETAELVATQVVAALHRGDVYVVLDSGEWRNLYPFVQMLRCPRCHATEVFFVDRADRQFSSVTMKSVERGHDEESAETANALLSWSDS